jgi:hypothetical protein
MKRLFLTFFVTLFAVALYGQTESPHLTFKGIPIDGNYKVFAQKLVQKGLKQQESSDTYIVLKGYFAGQSDVQIVVYSNPETNIVTSVAALIEVEGKWGQIENKYYNTVDLYKEKYGEPSMHFEEFTTDVYSDYNKCCALDEGYCNYQSSWEVLGGTISILPISYQREYYILCVYRDSQNHEAEHQSIIDDI